MLFLPRFSFHLSLGIRWFAWDAWTEGKNKSVAMKLKNLIQTVNPSTPFPGGTGAEGRAGTHRKERTDWTAGEERQTGEERPRRMMCTLTGTPLFYSIGMLPGLHRAQRATVEAPESWAPKDPQAQTAIRGHQVHLLRVQ